MIDQLTPAEVDAYRRAVAEQPLHVAVVIGWAVFLFTILLIIESRIGARISSAIDNAARRFGAWLNSPVDDEFPRMMGLVLAMAAAHVAVVGWWL